MCHTEKLLLFLGDAADRSLFLGLTRPMDSLLSGVAVGATMGALGGPVGSAVGGTIGGLLGLAQGKTTLLFFSIVYMQKEMTHLFILQVQKIKFSLVKV